ncbi:SDR family oxidoreductase (plasmid) [Rhizobium leguminosarum bv. viciae]|uniref:SDR family oxidoreductase n=1 Tax=Rhizobium leguminosarum bv. viciae TaxID=387 RepID=A0A7G6RNY1_RHILV|nr:SDR family oxidoreductase [Rhizobium leguminosarum bv. viciae]
MQFGKTLGVIMSDKTSLNDPRTLYPAPPFPNQPQHAPGLARKMDPTPDHGEESYRGSGKLTGRKALVTGGDSGIGRAAAIAFAREGADVAIAYLPDEEADAREVIGLIEAEGRKAVALPGDIKEEPWCLSNWSTRRSPVLAVSIFSSSILSRQQYREKIEDLSTEDFDKTMKTNLYALHWIAQAAVPHILGGICGDNDSFHPGLPAVTDLARLCHDKVGIVAYTKALAKQLIERGIRANVVAPGPVWTVLQPSGGQPDEKVKNFGKDSDFG